MRHNLLCPRRPVASRQKHIKSGLVIGVADISPTPPLTFTGGGVKKCEIWPRFSTAVSFKALWF